MSQSTLLIIVSAALAVSECLALIPSLQSNSILQFVINLLKNLEGSSAAAPAAPAAPASPSTPAA
jgi:hypothetical protein